MWSCKTSAMPVGRSDGPRASHSRRSPSLRSGSARPLPSSRSSIPLYSRHCLSTTRIVWQQDQGGDLREVSYREFQGWAASARSFESMTAIGSVNWGYEAVGGDGPYSIPISAVSASFFDTLGARPLLGRTFRASDDDERSTAGRVVVLSHLLWVQRFDADPGVVGRSVRLRTGAVEAAPFTVVGVMPPDFQFPIGAQLWTPVGPELESIRRADGLRAMTFLRVLFVVGRLQPGVSVDAARAELDTLIPRVQRDLAAETPEDNLRAVVTPLRDHIFGNARVALLLFAGSVGLVLLIANANVVGLLLVRSFERRRDTAVRTALGATRGRLLGYHLVEGGLIAAGGGALGVVLAVFGVPALVALGPGDVPRLDAVEVNVPVLAFAVVLTLACALVVVAGASLRFGDSWVSHWLKADAPGMTAGRSFARTRDVLLVFQVALALVALVAAGLLTASYANLVREALGFRPEGVLTLNVSLPDARYSLDQKRAFYRELLDNVGALPGVVGAAAVYQRPFENGPVGMDLVPFLLGQTPDEFENNPTLNLEAVTPGYFSVMGTRLIRGRVFTERDTVGSPLAVVMSESTARRLWPGADALGKRLLTVGEPPDEDGNFEFQTVVGIVEDARYREIQTPRLDLYVPFFQSPLQVQHVVVRTTGDPLLLAGPLREEVRRLDAQQVVDGVRTMEMVVSGAVRPWQFNMVVSALLASVAVILTALGLFSTVAYSVRQRIREIGLRLALGARRLDILALVMRRVSLLTVSGTALGLALAVSLAEFLDRLVFGIALRDPGALLAVSVLLILVGMSAGLVAARRGARVDPMVALRTE